MENFEFHFFNGKKSDFVPKIGGFGDPKRFSDLAQNWLIWGSDDIKLFKFGKFWIPFFQNGKKSNFVPKIGGFGRQKRFSDLAENLLIWGSDDMKSSKFGTFWIPFFPTGKKSDLLSNFEILSQIPDGEQRFFSVYTKVTEIPPQLVLHVLSWSCVH